MRKVGTESQRTYHQKTVNGFFNKYMWGIGLDVGYAGYTEGCLPILPTAVGVDINFPGYDGKILPFPAQSQNYVYSSHCLEHIDNYKQAIQEWYRVTKIKGYVITVVPHQFLYEKKLEKPSFYNEDHKRFYTPAKLLKEFEEALEPNTYRVRLLEDGDDFFDYDRFPTEHSTGQYEITLVIQRIKPPVWDLA